MTFDQSALHFKFAGMGSSNRLRELILYIADKCTSDSTFGATKLNKILYFADFHSYAKRGQPITGTAYMRLDNGPVPKALLPVRNDMEEKGELVVRRDYMYGPQYEQHKVIALRNAELDMFTGTDIAIVDSVIEQTWGKTASQVSDESHGIAWRLVNDRQAIPYEAALLSDEPLSDQEIARSLELAALHDWDV